MIGIISAMQIEALKIKTKIDDKLIQNFCEIEFVSGTLNGKEVVIAACNPGKVNAAICAQIMILKYSPEIIINIGVAGALVSQLSIGDVIIGNYCVQHDVDTSPLGDPKGFISGIKMVKFPCSQKIIDTFSKSLQSFDNIHYVTETIATGDQFLNNENLKKSISQEFNAFACEMEGASVAHVCYVNKIDFGIIRIISDNADSNSGADYERFLSSTAEKLTDIVNKFVELFQ